MRVIVQQLQLPKAMYNPKKYPNPALQWHYKILQAMAMEEEVPEKAEDATQPKFKAISKRAGGYLEDWSETLEKESVEARNARASTAIKREAESDIPTRPAKRSRAGSEKPISAGLRLPQIKALVGDGGITKMTVAQLKDLLGAKGLSTAGKKMDLIERVEQWVEENA